MALILKIDGNEIIRLEKDYSVDTSENRNIMENIIFSEEQYLVIDLVATRKEMIISGKIADGDNGLTIAEWINKLRDLTPNNFYVGSIEDTDGIYNYDNCKFINIRYRQEPEMPNIIFYSIRVLIADVLE